MNTPKSLVILWSVFAVLSLPASASELSYTFMDFQSLNNSVDAAGIQRPVLTQTVSVNAGDGDGIAVAGSMGVGRRFYLSGYYRSSIIDVQGVITNPLTTLDVQDSFDLVLANLAFGYIHAIGESLDLVAEVSYDSSNYDFGSFAGENFDLDDTGTGARLGFRWNPRRPVELFVFGRYSDLAKPVLSGRVYDKGSSINAGVRWYFFEDLGVGVEYESGDNETMTLSMRFSFGNLPW